MRPVDVVSPTSAAALLLCPLRFAYRAQASGAVAPIPAPFAALGLICHGVLARIARERPDPLGDWRALFDTIWAQVTATVATPGLGPPQSWPYHDRRKAATRRIGRELAAELQDDGLIALPEEPLQALGGRLRGRADLVLRGTRHEIRDYKSGRAPEGTAQDLQLLLYAAMERVTGGSLPGRLAYIPLKGPPVEVDPSRHAVERAEESVARGLAAYNEAAGSDALTMGRPGADNCSWCPNLTRCPVAWESMRGSWEPLSGAAVTGAITEATLTPGGAYRLEVAVQAGSGAPRDVTIHRLAEWQAVGATPALGAAVAATGLRPAGERELVATDRTECRVVANPG